MIDKPPVAVAPVGDTSPETVAEISTILGVVDVDLHDQWLKAPHAVGARLPAVA